jgi:hypothetical protein
VRLLLDVWSCLGHKDGEDTSLQFNDQDDDADTKTILAHLRFFFGGVDLSRSVFSWRFLRRLRLPTPSLGAFAMVWPSGLPQPTAPSIPAKMPNRRSPRRLIGEIKVFDIEATRVGRWLSWGSKSRPRIVGAIVAAGGEKSAYDCQDFDLVYAIIEAGIGSCE